MILKNKMTFLLVMLIILSSCDSSLPDQLPDIGTNIEELELNQFVSLAATKSINTFKVGDSISLEITNNSDKSWDYNESNDIFIYQWINKEWITVQNNMKYMDQSQITVTTYIYENGVRKEVKEIATIGGTEFSLGPRGTFPEDKSIISVLPDIKLKQPAYLRIFVLVHEKNLGDKTNSKGAYVDVVLTP